MALSISRRSFMKCVGITAFATATGTLMTGCSSGPVTGDFGGSFPLYELTEPISNITINTLEWNPFDVSVSEIESALDVSLDVPNLDLGLWALSNLSGYGCVMPKGLIQNTSDKTLIVLPYFTGDTLNTVLDEFVYPTIHKNTNAIEDAIEALLLSEQKTIADALNKIIADNLSSTIQTILGLITQYISQINVDDLRGLLKENKPIPVKITWPFPMTIYIKLPLNSLLIKNWPESIHGPILTEIRKLIDSQLTSLSDLFRILMVQGRNNGQSGDSLIDQALNAAAAGYALVKQKNSLMLNTIGAHSTAAGYLPVPAKRTWRSLLLFFSTKKVNISVNTADALTWANVSDLVVEALIYYIFTTNNKPIDTSYLAKEIVNVVLPLLTKENMKLSIEESDGQLGLQFQNSFVL